MEQQGKLKVRQKEGKQKSSLYQYGGNLKYLGENCGEGADVDWGSVEIVR